MSKCEVLEFNHAFALKRESAKRSNKPASEIVIIIKSTRDLTERSLVELARQAIRREKFEKIVTGVTTEAI